ncbi:hypothetical protein WJ41_02955 [Burkholderia ubonensis]|nr:hypothetical protein WJ41_02955 [Burkholderia ubonensis]KVU09925.1 hypothetical protein WK61_24410 [Burkholderia ubonensis]KVU09988.1 hypothetical protein WK61_24755 [Burkholderia ubonensis]
MPEGWVRAHLLNQDMGGKTEWKNLAALTDTANKNHSSVENYIKNFVTKCRQWEDENYKNEKTGGAWWYGVYYVVQCASDPLYEGPYPSRQELYMYTPNFIRLSWRAVQLAKPATTYGQDEAIRKAHEQVRTGELKAVSSLPFSWTTQTFKGPSFGMTGDSVFGTIPRDFPDRKLNGFDGEIEVHILP